MLGMSSYGFSNLQNFGFNFVERLRDIRNIFVASACELSAGCNDFTNQVFLTNDFEVIRGIRGGRCTEDIRDDCRAADRVELSVVTQSLGEGDQITGLIMVPALD